MDHVLLVDMSIHHFDIARFLFGGAAARTVLCHEWNPPGSRFAHGASAVAAFEMEGGATFVYNGSWSAEGFMPSWQGTWRIIGERGSGALWDGETGFQAQVVDESERGRSKAVGHPVEVLAHGLPGAERGACVDRWRSSWPPCAAESAPETICTDNIKSLAMVFGAVESAGRGARVEISV